MCLGNVFLQPRQYETCCRPDLSSFLISFGGMKPKREKIEIEILRVWTMEALEKRRSDLNFRRIRTLTKMHCFFSVASLQAQGATSSRWKAAQRQEAESYDCG